MDTNAPQVRTATLVAEVEASGLEVGTKVRVVSGLVPFPQYAGHPGTDPAYYMVSVDEAVEFVDLESTDDPKHFLLWEYGTTVWAEPQALQFEDEDA